MGALDALRDTPAVFDASARGRVRVVGPDARAFLHRLSTQHVNALAPGEGRLNVLTTDKGRVVDVIHHLDHGDAGVLLLGTVANGAALMAWLDRYLFSEKLELSVVEGPCFEIAGGKTALAPWQHAGDAVRTFDRVDVSGERVPCVIVMRDVGDGDGVRGSDEEREVLRIASGVPGAGEVNDKHNPLDLGLHDAIHWNKGCYIGQEVIARLDTYQKQKRVLATLTGDDVKLGPIEGGEVTSVAPFRWGGRPNALAVGRFAGVERLGDVVVSRPVTAQDPHG